MINLNQITKIYHADDAENIVLKDFSLEVTEGEFVMLFGRSGCGKSTLLNIMGLIDSATSGEYILDGRIVHEMGRRELSICRNRKFGYVFQAFYLLPRITVLENVMLPMKYYGLDKTERVERARELLSQVGLDKMERSYSGMMSGGEKQRAAIARALANRPKYILADEPTGNLDLNNRNQIIYLLSDLNKHEGKTVIMVTHDRDLLRYADRVIEM